MTKSNNKTSATITDIARHCGVAISTVSLALRDEPRVKPETSKRIKEAAVELGYDPVEHDAARRLLSRHRKQRIINQLVALKFPAGYHQVQYFNAMTCGILDVLNNEEFSLLYARNLSYELSSDSSIVIPPFFRRGEIDGLIFFDFPRFSDIINRLRELPGFDLRPIISVIHEFPEIISIVADEEQGAYQSTKHLLELGHRYIAHIIYELILEGAPIDDNLQKRLNGVNRAIKDFDLNPAEHFKFLPMPVQWNDPTSIPANNNDTSFENENDGQHHPTIKYLIEHPEITAVLALNDSSAINLWYRLRRVGLNVPEDISIIGFDDTNPMLDHLGQNILSSVCVPLHEIGREAGRKIIECIRNESTETLPEKIILPTEFIIRNSTAPPPKQKRV